MLGFVKTRTRGLRQSEVEEKMTGARNRILREGWGRRSLPRGSGVKLRPKGANGWEKNVLDRGESTCKDPARQSMTCSRICLALGEKKLDRDNLLKRNVETQSLHKNVKKKE